MILAGLLQANRTTVTFKRCLLLKCQEEFERAEFDEENDGPVPRDGAPSNSEILSLSASLTPGIRTSCTPHSQRVGLQAPIWCMRQGFLMHSSLETLLV